MAKSSPLSPPATVKSAPLSPPATVKSAPLSPPATAGRGAGGEGQGPRAEARQQPSAPESGPRGAGQPAPAAAASSRTVPLEIGPDARSLSGRFLVESSGSYRFRFLDGERVVAEGPPIPLTAELDLPPEVRLTAPAAEVEVDARAVLKLAWNATDDIGLGELTLVVVPPAGAERRTRLRGFGSARREAGTHALDLAPLRLAEGEAIRYRLEVTDTDAVSGPKRAASATHVAKIYSQAEHHRAALLRARALWEDMVKLLGDRLELLAPAREGKAAGAEKGRAPGKSATAANGATPENGDRGGKRGSPGRSAEAEWTAERVAAARNLDLRTRELHLGLTSAAAELRRNRSAPRGVAQALANVASGIRPYEAELTELRAALARLVKSGGALAAVAPRTARADDALDRELEKGILYLEALLDQQRAQDLLAMAKDLAQRRRELADLVEKYRQAPSEEAKAQLLAEVARLKRRMQELLRNMAELAKGLSDEHMNREALEELAKANDALAGLDQVEKELAKGDLDAAAKALDQLANSLQQMMAQLERTSGRPAQGSSQLAREMMAFRKELDALRSAQEGLMRETEGAQAEVRRQVQERLASFEETAKRLQALAAEARRELAAAGKDAPDRAIDDVEQARDRLADLEKALAARDFAAALDVVKRALPPMLRLTVTLGDDATLFRRYGQAEAARSREAQRHAVAAVGPAEEVKAELEALFPDPQTLLGPEQRQKLGDLAGQQEELSRRLEAMRQKLAQLAQQAPIFPPEAGEALQGSQGHMERAAGELGQRNPQRGLGEQGQALDELARFQRGMERMAQNGPGGGGQGVPMPMMFGENEGDGQGQRESGGREGDGREPYAEKVEIPGADAFKAPEAFRKDLLDAMKQGAPEAYRGEVQRYYEELVK